MAREAFQTLTEPMYYILLALTGECCGVDIMNKVEELSHGRIRVGPGTLYAMLARFHPSDCRGRKAQILCDHRHRHRYADEGVCPFENHG